MARKSAGQQQLGDASGVREDGTYTRGYLSMREERDWWTAYYQIPSREHSVKLASIRIGAIQNPQVEQMFRDMCRQMITDCFEQIEGETVEWGEVKTTSRPAATGTSC